MAPIVILFVGMKGKIYSYQTHEIRFRKDETCWEVSGASNRAM